MSILTARLPGVALPSPGSGGDILVDEPAWVRAAARGDRAAFDILYQRYARMVHGILLTRVRPSEAEDLMQDVFLTALRKLPGLRSPEAFGAWLAAIARNRATQYHRDARSEADANRRACVADPVSVDGRTFEVLETIRQLPDAYRETLILRLVEGMTGPEIAERTGLTPESVRVNLSRGIRLLRNELGRGASR